jgi:hypothetical protein
LSETKRKEKKRKIKSRAFCFTGSLRTSQGIYLAGRQPPCTTLVREKLRPRSSADCITNIAGYRFRQAQEDVIPVCERALAARRPVVIDVQADPNVIALPSHTTLEQSKKFFEALAKGDPDRVAILQQLYRQMKL